MLNLSVASILFKPLSTGAFKWKGEFTPQARGPQQYYRSEPLPLPSTVAGTLSGLLLETFNKPLCGSGNEVYSNVYRGLNIAIVGKDVATSPDIVLRGPYLYIKTSAEEKMLCSVYGIGSKLLCFTIGSTGVHELEIHEWKHVTNIGIGLDSVKKTTIEGLIYTSTYHDIVATATDIVKRSALLKKGVKLEDYGILVEIYTKLGANVNRNVIFDTLKKTVDSKIVTLGGEFRAFQARVLNETFIDKLISKIPSDRCLYWHIATPIMLCKEIVNEKSILKEKEGKTFQGLLTEYAEKLLEKLLELMKLEKCSSEYLPKNVVNNAKIKFSVLGLGYDICLNKRRPMCRNVEPGSGLLGKPAPNISPLEIYIKGVGSYSELGWGTVIPLIELKPHSK